MRVACAGIGTEIGKTYASAALCECLKLDYFKIVQAGLPKDAQLIKKLSPNVKIYEDGITLQTPASPHYARKLENKSYVLQDIILPSSQNLLCECAGGLYSPIDNEHCMIDFLSFHKLGVFLVANEYLGSINHTLLSLEALKQKNIKIFALIFRGVDEGVAQSSADFITNYFDVKSLWLPSYDDKTKASIFLDFKKNLSKINFKE